MSSNTRVGVTSGKRNDGIPQRVGVGNDTKPANPNGPGVRMRAAIAMGEVPGGGDTAGVPGLPTAKATGVQRRGDRR
jgi:hypothetical protein